MSNDATLLTFRTSQGVLYHQRESLVYISMTIRRAIEYDPLGTNFNLHLTFWQTYLAFRFLDTLRVPDDNQEWLDLIFAINYFDVIPVYQSLLTNAARDYLKSVSIPHYPIITLREIIEKLKNPYFVTEPERKLSLPQNTPCVHEHKKRDSCILI